MSPSRPSSEASFSMATGSFSSQESFPTEDTLDEDSPGSSKTAHTNPTWLKDLKKNFKKDVIERCSVKVREAVEKDAKIEDMREKRLVRNIIINTTVDRLIEIFGGVSRPRISEMREIVTEMQFAYPAMFRDEGVGTGYGFGGSKGVEGLANQMMDRLRSRDVGAKKPLVQVGVDAEGVEANIKKGKKKIVYG